MQHPHDECNMRFREAKADEDYGFHSGPDAVQALRDFEVNVLDVMHRAFPLWQCSEHSLAYALLAACDSYQLPILMSGAPTAVGALQLMQMLEDGLSQSFLWLRETRPRLGLCPSSEPQVISAACEAVYHAATYANLADFHRMLGADLCKVRVDTRKRVVRFEHVSSEEGFLSARTSIEGALQLDHILTASASRQLTARGGTPFSCARPFYAAQRARGEFGATGVLLRRRDSHASFKTGHGADWA